MISNIFNGSSAATSCGTLAGITIINGVSFGESPYHWDSSGGAVYMRISSPSVVNCRFIGNSSNRGGALSCEFESRPVVVGSLFQENYSNRGGAVSVRDFFLGMLIE